MPHEKRTVTVEGEITDVFAHRIVLRTAHGNVLADLGPEGAKKSAPKAGDKVKLSGEQKPSELKVATYESDGKIIEIADDAHDHEHEHAPADPAKAKAAVEKLGHTVVGEPHRKPKHFEVLAKDAEGRHHEHHIELDGKVKASKEADPSHDKWKLKRPKAA